MKASMGPSNTIEQEFPCSEVLHRKGAMTPCCRPIGHPGAHVFLWDVER